MITQLAKQNPITDKSGNMLDLFYFWMLNVSNLSVLSGIGSPEGLIEARSTRLYMDTTALTGSILYIKQVNDIAGDRTMGWVLV